MLHGIGRNSGVVSSSFPQGGQIKIPLGKPAQSPLTISGEDDLLHEPLDFNCGAAGVAGDQTVRKLAQRIDKDPVGILQ
jgi:hypothetical protein